MKLREKPHNPLTERLKTTAPGHWRPSDRTEDYLRVTGYRGKSHLNDLLRHVSAKLRVAPDREALHASAELCYLGAQSMSASDALLSQELCLDSAEAAWRYFSLPDDAGRLPDPNAPEHRSTAEVYNASCESFLRSVRKNAGYRLGQTVEMVLTSRRVVFEIPFPSHLLSLEQLGEFEFVSDYQVQNLRNRHVAAGLGVPVIVVRKPGQVPQPIEQYYTRGMSSAGTVLLRFPDGLPSGTGDPHEPVRMQLFDPGDSDGVVIRDTLLPLEKDLSTPLAKFLSNPDLRLVDTWGFFRPDRAGSIAGLYMVQPFDPDRIPVLMVHGLWSSPMTWMEMFNDLQADPEIHRRYQFWFYLYPTGDSLAIAAASLRDELERVRDDCDPQRSNTRLDEMVVVGHSLGGLMAHLLTISSEDRLWNAVSRMPVDQIATTPEEKSKIRRVYFFESNPAVRRIVTIASPYGGSRYSNAFTRRLSSSLIWLPAESLRVARSFARGGPGWWAPEVPSRTSIDSLKEDSPVLTLVRNTTVPDGVRHHNIVGIQRGESAEEWSDGVVTYRSAQRQNVTSQLLVSAGHSEVHRHPVTIAEVRRVLLEHLRDSSERRYPVIPVRHTAAFRPAAAARTLTP